MAASNVDPAVLGFMIPYLVLTLAVGLWASRSTKTLKDFVLAGRTLPFVVTTATMFAMFFGAETTLGAAYNAAYGGLSGDVIADPYGAALCLILYGLFYAVPLYKTSNLTLSDFYVERYGSKIGVCSALMNTLGYLMWTSGQIVGLGFITGRTWGVPKEVGALIATIIIVIYTFRGGMYAVAWTETLESVVIVICLIIMAVQVGKSTGISLVDSYRTYDERMGPDTGEPYGGFVGWINFFAMWMYIGTGSIPSQDIYERMNAAKKSSYAMFAAILAGFLYITIAQIPMYFGMVARQEYFREICGSPEPCDAADLENLDEGTILDLMMMHSTRQLSVVFYAAYVSAILSTASGTLLGAGVLITINMIRPARPDMAESRVLLWSRITTAVFAACSYAFSFALDHISDFVNLSSALLMVGLFWPLTFGIYWKRGTAVGAGFSMFSGVITYIVCYLTAHFHPNIGDGAGWQLHNVDTLLYATFAGFIMFIVGSLMPKGWQDAVNSVMDSTLGRIPMFAHREHMVIKVDAPEEPLSPMEKLEDEVALEKGQETEAI